MALALEQKKLNEGRQKEWEEQVRSILPQKTPIYAQKSLINAQKSHVYVCIYIYIYIYVYTYISRTRIGAGRSKRMHTALFVCKYLCAKEP